MTTEVGAGGSNLRRLTRRFYRRAPFGTVEPFATRGGDVTMRYTARCLFQVVGRRFGSARPFAGRHGRTSRSHSVTHTRASVKLTRAGSLTLSRAVASCRRAQCVKRVRARLAMGAADSAPTVSV